MSRRAWAAFVTVAVLWGLPYLFIRVAVTEVSPVFVAWSRLVIATAILLPFAASRGGLRAALLRWRWVLLLGAYYMALAWTLIPSAERQLPSSLTAIVIACVPIVVALINLGRERPPPARIAGLLIGFAGIVALVGLDVAVHPDQLPAVASLFVVLLCYALGPVMASRKLGGIDPVATSALAAAFAAALLTPLMPFSFPRHPLTPQVIAALAALGLLCSTVALVAWFFLIRAAGPGRATVVIYINPAVAVLAGVVILHERITGAMLAGMVLILAGSILATTGHVPFMSRIARRPAAEPAEVAEAATPPA